MSVTPSPPQLLSLEEVRRVYGPVLDMQVHMHEHPLLPSLQNAGLLSMTLYVYVCVYLHMYAQYVCYIPYCVYVCTCVCTVHPVSVYIRGTC